MERMEKEKNVPFKVQNRAYFQSDIHINLESTDVNEILAKVIQKSLKI